MQESATLRKRLEEAVLRPLTGTSPGYVFLVSILLVVIGIGVYAWITQLYHGLGVTGMNNRVSWGVYITNFVFFIGISHAGTLLSAILRVTNTRWRLPITRMAEVITVVSLLIGASMILIDMGRLDRILNLIFYGRIHSALVWDLLSVTSYLVGSITFLWIPLIPDLAMCRDRLGNSASRFQQALYRILSLGWVGSTAQRVLLEKSMGIMQVVIIPVAVSVHTIISWIFAMTVRPGWNSTVFGPYFVVGAIFSGIATIMIVMAIFRKVFRLEEFITKEHFEKLGFLFLALTLMYAYFTIGEYLTVAYKAGGYELENLNLLFAGEQALLFWFFFIGGLIVPALLIIFPKTRTVAGLTLAAILVNIGMWIKRYVIIVPSLQTPLLPLTQGAYHPTWVEWSITAAAFAAFILLFAIFARFFPIICVWEMVEETEKSHAVKAIPAEGRTQA